MVGISIKNFGISFGEMEILKDVSFSVNAGEIVTILGPSGSGKSTILRAIASLENSYDGDILLNENCLICKNECNKDIGYIFQDYALFPHLNVKENIEFALHKLSRIEKDKKVNHLLKEFDLVEHKDKQSHELSGGQQQRVSIARAIAYEPKILLLDEPFSNLDSLLREKTKLWLKKMIKELGLSAILVTHDQKEALSMSDKIGIIHDKKIVQFGTPKKLFEEPKNLYIAKFLGDINILPFALAQTFFPDITKEQKAILRVNKTKISTKTTKFTTPYILKEISYCGDYSELIIVNKEDENNFMTIRQNLEIDVFINDIVYLEFKEEDIIFIK
ncbi:ABC transporter ATP-binding protein [Sulfurimonas sp.]|uniref:ABC transporter ATP-binding protein n=1 Tax=Sulfurimonas sp. TaxID=2022749 RepID=UPI0025FDEB88|nr:ABC transporter ATP-binding protein [Sulfurimonas sp.]